MKLLGREILEAFLLEHADARGAIATWVAEVEAAKWQTPHDLKFRYASASILGGKVVIFNIKGNAYRLEAWVTYKTPVVLVNWVGTHSEYSKR
jgi:mRNA interferase HigB